MGTDRMILGEGCVYSMDSLKTGLNNNVIVCGSSGCGKTMSISEPRLLETYNSSLITTVTKRRIVNKYKKLMKSRGYKVYDLNFINPSESDIAYDPLEYICSYTDITHLAESIVYADQKKEKSNADPYWDHAAVSLLSAEIAFTIMTKDDATFADVLELHDSIDFVGEDGQIRTSLDAKFDIIESEQPNCFAVSCYKTFRRLPMRTASCVFSSLNTTIDTIFSPEIRDMIANKKKIDFEELSNERTVLFISTSPVNPSLQSFINMFYAQAFKQLFEIAEDNPDGKLAIPVHVLCDDFATGGRINNFPEYISIFREKQISVSLLLQSESQLESMYGSEDATTIINNCDSYIYMGGMDLKTAKSVSERLNAPLEDVLYMDLTKEVVFRRGQKPIRTHRYNILENSVYKRITVDIEER